MNSKRILRSSPHEEAKVDAASQGQILSAETNSASSVSSALASVAADTAASAVPSLSRKGESEATTAFDLTETAPMHMSLELLGSGDPDMALSKSVLLQYFWVIKRFCAPYLATDAIGVEPSTAMPTNVDGAELEPRLESGEPSLLFQGHSLSNFKRKSSASSATHSCSLMSSRSAIGGCPEVSTIEYPFRVQQICEGRCVLDKVYESPSELLSCHPVGLRGGSKLLNQ